MKDFILGSSKGIINVFAAFVFLLIFIVGIGFILSGDEFNCIIGFSILVGGSLLSIFAFFWVYLIIDIDDNLQELNNKFEMLLNYKKVEVNRSK